MAFEVYGAGKTDTPQKSDVDFDAINAYVVETAGLQNRETMVGVISMIVDLGEQNLPDAENTFTGNAAEEAEQIAAKPDTYFKDGFDHDTKKNVRLKCYPQKPQQCVAFAVDFPDILVDKGQFFGDSTPLPLRMWLGGQFYIQGSGMVVGRPTPLKYTNLDKTRKTKVWSLGQLTLPYKMAVASKLIKAGEPFLPDRVDELLGKALQFTTQIYFKAGKNDKKYYTEYINFAAATGRGQAIPTLVGEPMLVQFNVDNGKDAIKNMRNHVVNTIKCANNYEGSPIQAQIEEVRGGKPAESAPATPAPVAAKPAAAPVKQAAPQPAEDFDSFDDDIPF